MSDDDNQDGDMDMSGLPEAIAIDETSRQSFENGQDGDGKNSILQQVQY